MAFDCSKDSESFLVEFIHILMAVAHVHLRPKCHLIWMDSILVKKRKKKWKELCFVSLQQHECLGAQWSIKVTGMANWVLWEEGWARGQGEQYQFKASHCSLNCLLPFVSGLLCYLWWLLTSRLDTHTNITNPTPKLSNSTNSKLV